MLFYEQAITVTSKKKGGSPLWQHQMPVYLEKAVYVWRDRQYDSSSDGDLASYLIKRAKRPQYVDVDQSAWPNYFNHMIAFNFNGLTTDIATGAVTEPDDARGTREPCVAEFSELNTIADNLYPFIVSTVKGVSHLKVILVIQTMTKLSRGRAHAAELNARKSVALPSIEDAGSAVIDDTASHSGSLDSIDTFLLRCREQSRRDHVGLLEDDDHVADFDNNEDTVVLSHGITPHQLLSPAGTPWPIVRQPSPKRKRSTPPAAPTKGFYRLRSREPRSEQGAGDDKEVI
jgi:hypothetical protein